MSNRARRVAGVRIAIVVLAASAAGCVPGAVIIPGTSGNPSNTYTIPDDIPYGTTCDPGMPDASAGIQAWLDSLPSGATASLPGNRCYRTELPIMIRAKSNFTFDGNGSKLQAFTDGCADQSNDGVRYNNCTYTSPVNAWVRNWPRSRSRFYIAGNTNLVVREISVDGGHPNAGPDGNFVVDLEAQHAFDLWGNNNGVTIDNVRADRVYGDWLYISGARNVIVQNSVFGEDNGVKSGNGRQGFTIVEGTNLTFTNNRFMNVRRSHVDIEPVSNSAVIRDVRVEKNTFGRSRLNWFANQPYGTANALIENIYFIDNRLVNEAFDVDIVTPTNPDPNDPSTYRRRNYQFIGNSSNLANGTPQGNLMRIMGVDGVVLDRNTAPVQPGRVPPMVLAEFNYSRNIRVTENVSLNGQVIGRYTTSGSGSVLVNSAFCERGNLVGNPLFERVDTSTPTCS